MVVSGTFAANAIYHHSSNTSRTTGKCRQEGLAVASIVQDVVVVVEMTPSCDDNARFET